MEWQSVLLSVVSIVLTALVTWGAERLIALINCKLNNSKYAKYLVDATNIIATAVKSTYQTYVQSLKNEDMFTKETQGKALVQAREMAISQLSCEVKNYIGKNFGNVEVWINSNIESIIYDLKNACKN